MSEKRYLTAENVDEVSAEDIQEYPLPYDPETFVRVRSVSISRMRQYFESSKNGGAVARKALCSLIADSIVDTDGKPIWSGDKVERITQGKTRFINALQQMIEVHNGGKDKLEGVDSVEKNSEETN